MSCSTHKLVRINLQPFPQAGDIIDFKSQTLIKRYDGPIGRSHLQVNLRTARGGEQPLSFIHDL